MRLHLVNPRPPQPSYFCGEVFGAWGSAPVQTFADLAVATVAGFAPRDWAVTICDECVQPVDLDVEADIVGLTGKISQAPRIIELAAAFHARGRVVMIGGPCASLSPECLREHADILVIGELEDIAATLFADLEAGRWKQEYRGERPDLARSPLPRWDLYPNHRALSGCVQTARGCPFSCEFCDVIAYLGQRQRFKPIDRVLAELDLLYQSGYRTAFLADDNLTASRGRARELLTAIAAWNRSNPHGPMLFNTQVSIDVARTPDLVALCAAAGIESVFIGIETPNVESLKASHKPQNLVIDLQRGVEVFLEHGMTVRAGMMVGFDDDDLDIFERQLQFARQMPVPIFSVGALVAPSATPLHARLLAAGRLVADGSEIPGAPWETNILPARFSRDDLHRGLAGLTRALYAPAAVLDRICRMVDTLAPHPLPTESRRLRAVDSEPLVIVQRLAALGTAEADLVQGTLRAVTARPHTARAAMGSLVGYAQARFMFDHGHLWDSPA